MLSPLETFNNFGSTIGSDVGINALREFGPGVRQTVKCLRLKFVSRIEASIAHNQTRMGVAPVTGRCVSCHMIRCGSIGLYVAELSILFARAMNILVFRGCHFSLPGPYHHWQRNNSPH
jgi:hypothetical protein